MYNFIIREDIAVGSTVGRYGHLHSLLLAMCIYFTIVKKGTLFLDSTAELNLKSDPDLTVVHQLLYNLESTFEHKLKFNSNSATENMSKQS